MAENTTPATPATGAGPGAVLGGASPSSAAARSGKTPAIRAVVESLLASLERILPDALIQPPVPSPSDKQRGEVESNERDKAFQSHMTERARNLAQERALWTNSLQYVYKALTEHHKWRLRNQRYVKLREDKAVLARHQKICRSSLVGVVDKVQNEIRRRQAVLEDRLGAFQLIVQIERIARDLSVGPVQMEINVEPASENGEQTVSVYCDSFVIDITLANGQGEVKSVKLTHVSKDNTRSNVEADEDLVEALEELARGHHLTLLVKLHRLLRRAETSSKFPHVDLLALEERAMETIKGVCKTESAWDLRLAADGWTLSFEDAFQVPAATHSWENGMRTGQEPPIAVGDGSNVTLSESEADGIVGATPKLEVCIGFCEWHDEAALELCFSHALRMKASVIKRIAALLATKDEKAGPGGSRYLSELVQMGKAFRRGAKYHGGDSHMSQESAGGPAAPALSPHTTIFSPSAASAAATAVSSHAAESTTPTGTGSGSGPFHKRPSLLSPKPASAHGPLQGHSFGAPGTPMTIGTPRASLTMEFSSTGKLYQPQLLAQSRRLNPGGVCGVGAEVVGTHPQLEADVVVSPRRDQSGDKSAAADKERPVHFLCMLPPIHAMSVIDLYSLPIPMDRVTASVLCELLRTLRQQAIITAMIDGCVPRELARRKTSSAPNSENDVLFNDSATRNTLNLLRKITQGQKQDLTGASVKPPVHHRAALYGSPIWRQWGQDTFLGPIPVLLDVSDQPSGIQIAISLAAAKFRLSLLVTETGNITADVEETKAEAGAKETSAADSATVIAEVSKRIDVFKKCHCLPICLRHVLCPILEQMALAAARTEQEVLASRADGRTSSILDNALGDMSGSVSGDPSTEALQAVVGFKRQREEL